MEAAIAFSVSLFILLYSLSCSTHTLTLCCNWEVEETCVGRKGRNGVLFCRFPEVDVSDGDLLVSDGDTMFLLLGGVVPPLLCGLTVGSLSVHFLFVF